MGVCSCFGNDNPHGVPALVNRARQQLHVGSGWSLMWGLFAVPFAVFLAGGGFLLIFKGLNNCGVGGECVLRRGSVHGGCGWWRGWIAETRWGIVAFGWVRLRIFVFK